MHKRVLGFLLFLFPLLACSGDGEITWEDLIPVSEKKVKYTDMFGMKGKMNWPVFSAETLKKNHTLVSLQGYYREVETVDMMNIDDPENPKTIRICMLTVSKEYTISICGLPQFRQHEFCVLEGFPSYEQGKLIELRGKLELNTEGGDENLIRLVK